MEADANQSALLNMRLDSSNFDAIVDVSLRATANSGADPARDAGRRGRLDDADASALANRVPL
jgi:hypothetical protein